MSAASSSNVGEGDRWGSFGLRIERTTRPWLSWEFGVAAKFGILVVGVSKLALVATWPVFL